MNNVYELVDTRYHYDWLLALKYYGYKMAEYKELLVMAIDTLI